MPTAPFGARRSRRVVAVVLAVAAVLAPAASAAAAGGDAGAAAKQKLAAAAKAKAATQKQLTAAAKVAADEKTQLTALQGNVAAAQAKLPPLQITARRAVAAYTAAAGQLAQAEAAQAAAATRLAAAAAEVVRQQAVVNGYAAAAYAAGGPSSTLATIFTSNGPGDLLYRAGVVNAIGKRTSDVLADLDAAQQVRDAAASAAEAATAAVAKDVAARDAARAAAVAAMVAQQQAVHTLLVDEAALNRRIESQQKTIAGLHKQRDELAAQEAAAKAAIIAAARATWASLRATTSTLPEASPAQGLAAVAWARQQLGVPYSWAGGDASGPTLGAAEADGTDAGVHTVGFDCSGLTLFAWAHVGFALDHFTGYQWLEGRQVEKADLRPGDLVFFATDITDPLTIHHVGMYVGNGMMIDAPHTGAVVRYDPAFNNQYIGAVRP